MNKYRKIFALPRNLVAEDTPVCILRGFLLYDAEKERFVAQLKLKNISQKKIASLTVRIIERNASGVNYREHVSCIYDAVGASPEATFGAKKAILLPHKGVRSFAVSVCEVVFTDGTNWENTALFEPLPEQKPLRSVLSHDAQVGWRAHFGKKAVYQPAEQQGIWLCTCGTPNGGSADTCSACAASREELFSRNMEKLALEGFVHRVKTLVARKDEKSLERAAALIAKAPEGVNRTALQKLLGGALYAYEQERKRVRKRRKICLFTSIPAALIVVAMLLLTVLYFVPNAHYQRGMDYLRTEQYYEAYSEFYRCRGFKDTQKQILDLKTTVRDETEALIEQQNFDEARALMLPFKDAENPTFFYNFREDYRFYLYVGDGEEPTSAYPLTEGTQEYYFTTGDTYFVFLADYSGYSRFRLPRVDLRYHQNLYLYNEKMELLDEQTDALEYRLQRGEIYILKVTNNTSKGFSAELTVS